MFHAQVYAIRYFATARVPWDGLGGVPYGPVQVSDGEKDGWTLGSTISYDAQATPTTPPDSKPEIEVESQCLEENVSEIPVTEAVPGVASVSPDAKAESADGQAAIGCRHEAPKVCFTLQHVEPILCFCAHALWIK